MSQRTQKKSLQPFDAQKYRVGIVVAQFNADITEALLASALAMAKKCKVPTKNITICRVAGSVEIPVMLKALAEAPPPGGGRYEALVALGAIIRGDTDHYDYVAKIVTEGVLAVMMDNTTPVGFGVLTCNTPEQAKTRLASGGGAMLAALHCARSIAILK